MPDLLFLKLGGSLITDKTRPHTARLDVLARLAGEIFQALTVQPELRLVLGHGSGSYGHVPARQYGTRQGVKSDAEWRGFIEVWREANALNRAVMDALAQAGLPALAVPPSAAVVAQDGQVLRWDLGPIQAALQTGLVTPVIFGDVVFDTARGGTILSTEDLFAHLARELKPGRVLLAGREAGVWADFPACTRLVREITAANFPAVSAFIGASASPDVTGGMLSKVQQSLDLAQALPGLQVRIFSGLEPGAVGRALRGEFAGTLIH